MPLSWNEIRSRAIAFSREFRDDTSEDAEAKTFWDEFFQVFGISRRRVASFEQPVRRTDGRGGFLDLLWKGVLVVEHKSRGHNLDRAYSQATNYFSGLKERDLPRFVLVSDFARFRLYDLETGTTEEFDLQQLHKKVGLFGFIAGYQSHRPSGPEEAVNIRAAEQLGKLHDQLKAAGYVGHPLEVLLVRILFCLFADDTGIFEKHAFRDYLDQRTSEDGSDLGMHLAHLFQVLNQQRERRQSNLDEQLASFAYINGRLFEEPLDIPAFDRRMRETLLDASRLDWSEISPAIFGSLFQSIMDRTARRNLGAHYTREANILKVLQPLFLDALQSELETIGNNSKRLIAFQKKLAGIRVLDPACGCGNFLAIAYRELRRIELVVLQRLYKIGLSSKTLDIGSLVFVDVDQFYGIEIEEFPAQIAQVAMWLTDHQMNLQISAEFGQYFARLPLVKSPNVVYGPQRGNALSIEWSDVVGPRSLSYIVGNPPFVGKQFQSETQKADVRRVFHDVSGAATLDYVSCWYRKAVDYMQFHPEIRAAFVSTNSITQGEQVGVLWADLLGRGARIQFAHRTFEWSSEAPGKAAVHCVIIGFALRDDPPKRLFEYDSVSSQAHEVRASNISPYLVDAVDVVLQSRRTPICDVPELSFGSMPNDGGHLLLEQAERDRLVAADPGIERFIRPFIGSVEFINGQSRYCFWLTDASPREIRAHDEIVNRLALVRAKRLKSKRKATRDLAATPALFGENRQPGQRYLGIPKTSSERRPYIPMGFLESSTIASTELFTIPDASTYHFGVLSSMMHMAWVRAVCGRLKSDYRYSSEIVYNNFPWPDPTASQRQAVEVAANQVLAARSRFPESTLADLYDPISMPAELTRAHQILDRAVDITFGTLDFRRESERVAFLFDRYQSLTSPLVRTGTNRRPRSRRSPASPGTR